MWGMRFHKNKPLTIGVDARPLIYPFNGNAQYLHKMLRELLLKRPNDRWSFFLIVLCMNIFQNCTVTEIFRLHRSHPGFFRWDLCGFISN